MANFVTADPPIKVPTALTNPIMHCSPHVSGIVLISLQDSVFLSFLTFIHHPFLPQFSPLAHVIAIMAEAICIPSATCQAN